MIKIIEPGKFRVIRCPKCECKFSYERQRKKGVIYGESV